MIGTEEETAVSLDAYNVPRSLHGGLIRYLFHRVEPGSFLRACLENDLVEALKRADDANRIGLANLVHWMYQELPAREYKLAWGSAEIVQAWLDRKDEREG